MTTTYVVNNYHYHSSYHGDFNNFGQHSSGQGTISNTALQTTDYLQSSSDQPKTTNDPTTTHYDSAPGIQSDDQPAELKSPPETTIQSAPQAQSEDQPTDLKNFPETIVRPVANTTNVGRNIRRNIVVIGQAMSEKSTIINLLADSPIANVSGGPAGCTPSNKHYYISHGGDNYTFWDMPGLEEAKNNVSLGCDVHNILNVAKDHGVNLLMYCIRGSLADITRINYEFFWKILCVGQVPIILVVSGLEGRADVDGWWQRNIVSMKKMKMVFVGHACLPNWKGVCEKELAENLWKLVRDHSTPKPWHMTPEWSVQAQQIITVYGKHFKARTMRKPLQELSRSLC